MMKIRVNGREIDTEAKTLSYEEVCTLEYGKVPVGLITVVHHVSAEGGWERSGSLTPGGPSVDVLEGMRISAYHTGNA